MLLTRKPLPEPVSPPGIATEIVTGDVGHPESYAAALAGCDTVLHLAAATGRAARSEFESVNVKGTQALVAACERAGVRNFLFVSTIAVRYPDKRRYPYAESKQRAEDIVRASSLRFTIVRPTIVVARDAPIWQSLVRLATSRVMLMPGPGTARVQPIHVDDMVAAFIEMLDDDRFSGETVEIGGADVASFENLLRGIHRRRTGREPTVLHLPLTPIAAALFWMERLIGPALPITAGQLSAFANDSIAEMPRTSMRTHVRGLDQIIRECAGGPPR